MRARWECIGFMMMIYIGAFEIQTRGENFIKYLAHMKWNATKRVLEGHDHVGRLSPIPTEQVA